MANSYKVKVQIEIVECADAVAECIEGAERS
jgi:hypothetical protein